MIALAALALGLVLWLTLRGRGGKKRRSAADLGESVESVVSDILVVELAETALGLRRPSSDEIRPLRRSLAGDPDADVVGKIEAAVRSIELEFVRFAHEDGTDLVVHVRYEDGRASKTSRRIPATDIPAAVNADFDRTKSQRVFREWTFPWARAHAL